MTDAQEVVLVLGTLTGKIAPLDCGCIVVNRANPRANPMYIGPISAVRFLMFATKPHTKVVWEVGHKAHSCGHFRHYLRTWYNK